MTTNEARRNVALAAHDRIDVIVMGRAPAARHRVLRLIDPMAAAALRSAATPLAAQGPYSAPTGAVGAIRGRLSALLAAAPAGVEKTA